VKYFSNVWGAMKVTWANEMYECCEALGIDYREVRNLWLNDKMATPMHTSIFKDRGFAGRCFPKDLRAFIKTAENAGYDPKLLKEVIRTNNRVRRTVRSKMV